MTTRSKGHNDIATYTPAARVREQMALCACGYPLRFPTNGMGELLEVCDRCTAEARRKPSTLETQAMTTVATPGTRATPPHALLGKPASALPPPVVGKPCQHCGQKVKPAKVCNRCKKHPRQTGGRLCDECAKPKSEKRYCVRCGTPFEYVFGQKTGRRGGHRGDGTRCPTHRAKD